MLQEKAKYCNFPNYSWYSQFWSNEQWKSKRLSPPFMWESTTRKNHLNKMFYA